jgi:hypothetical protein
MTQALYAHRNNKRKKNYLGKTKEERPLDPTGLRSTESMTLEWTMAVFIYLLTSTLLHFLPDLSSDKV